MSNKSGKGERNRHLETIAKVAQTLVPYADTADVLYKDVIRPQLSRRGLEFLQAVLDRIFVISENKSNISVDSILGNPDIAAFLMEAAQSAVLTSNEEKLEALRNAAVNFAIGIDPGEDRRQLFLRAISDFTPTHLCMLKILQSPMSCAQAHGIESFSLDATVKEVMSLAFSDFDENLEFYRLIHAELGARGFAVEMADTGGFKGKIGKRTTGLGDALLGFISSPEKEESVGG